MTPQPFPAGREVSNLGVTMPLRRQILVCVLSLLALISACEPDISIKLEAQAPNLEARATIMTVEFDASDSTVKYFADVSISNTSAVVQPYSNKWLRLESVDTESARAYLDSIASHHIDVGTVDLAPNESLDLRIYWVIPSAELEETSSEPFVLALRPES